jgi:hypothetical protein
MRLQADLPTAADPYVMPTLLNEPPDDLPSVYWLGLRSYGDNQVRNVFFGACSDGVRSFGRSIDLLSTIAINPNNQVAVAINRNNYRATQSNVDMRFRIRT